MKLSARNTSLLLGMVLCSNADAAMFDGTALHGYCASVTGKSGTVLLSKELLNARTCGAYVNGVADTMDEDLCSAEANSVLPVQLALIVKKYLSENPEKLHLSGSQLVIEALTKAFPCN